MNMVVSKLVLYILLVYCSTQLSAKLNESKISKVFPKLSNTLENEINTISSVYNEILKLNEAIKITNFINIDDIPKLQEDTKRYLEYENRILEIRNKRIVQHYPSGSFNPFKSEFPMLQHKLGGVLNMLRNHLNGVDDTDSGMFRTKIWSKFIDYENRILKSLIVIKFNLEKKTKLKEIYEKWGHQDFVKDLLLELYQMRIRQLNQNLL